MAMLGIRCHTFFQNIEINSFCDELVHQKGDLEQDVEQEEVTNPETNKDEEAEKTQEEPDDQQKEDTGVEKGQTENMEKGNLLISFFNVLDL